MDLILSWLDTDLATALTNLGAVGFAWAVFGLVLLVWVRRDQKGRSEKDRAPAPVAARFEVDTYELDTSGWAWRDRYRGGHREHRTGAVCDRTAVDEVRRVTEEVAG